MEIIGYITTLIFLPLSMFVTILGTLFPPFQPFAEQILEVIAQFTTI